MAWPLLAEAQRQLAVCNACRYCEGYCAVFPALERRAIVLEGDLAYLANLCHDCRAYLQACMYPPPHEFVVDVPALLARARADSYQRLAWPRWLAGAFARGPLALATATLAGLAAAVIAAVVGGGAAGLIAPRTGPGSFYALIPYLAMAIPALLLTAYALAVLGVGAVRLWRAAGGGVPEAAGGRSWATALREGLELRWLRGGGPGCYYPDAERPSSARRHLHVLLVAGLGVAFAATLVAAAGQDLLGLDPPYPLWSPPVLRGAGGGAATVRGAGGLLWLKVRSGRTSDRRGRGLDLAFLASILAVSATGMLLLAFRETPAIGPLLVAHLATLGGLYLTAPYGKLAHAAYRLAALLRSAAERSA